MNALLMPTAFDHLARLAGSGVEVLCVALGVCGDVN